MCYYWYGLQQQQQYLQQGYKQRFHDYIQANNIEMPTVRIQSVHTITATYIKNLYSFIIFQTPLESHSLCFGVHSIYLEQLTVYYYPVLKKLISHRPQKHKYCSKYLYLNLLKYKYLYLICLFFSVLLNHRIELYICL